MSDATDRAACLVQLEIFCPLADVPDISAHQEGLLDKARRARIWTNNTAYVVGDVIIPTVRNGHRYRAIQAGTSEALLADEPEWTLIAGEMQGDGAGDLLWQEDGPDYANLYDPRIAIHAGWAAKAAIAAREVSKSAGDARVETEQRYQHCLQMMAAYAPFEMA